MKDPVRPSGAVKLIIVSVVTGVVTLIALTGGREKAAASASGPSPSFTSAPGEDNCTACHTQFPVNTGGGGVTISGIPHDYLPGQQVTVSVKTTQEDAVKIGRAHV